MADENTLHERIQLLVDGRLDESQRRALEQELATNPEARTQLESMRWLKQATQKALGDAPQDDRMLDGIRGVLDRADADNEQTPARTSRHGVGRFAAAAMILLAALAVLWGTWSPATPLPQAVADDVHDLEKGRLSMQLRSSDPEQIEAFFAQQGIDFETRVFDLAMMEFRLVGGVTNELGGTPSAAFAYLGPEAIEVLCQMYRGKIEDLPPADDVREHDGIVFYSYKRKCVSMTFWREGDVICVLASMADLEQVVSLAFAKAVKV